MRAPWIQVSIDTQDLAGGREHAAHARAIAAEWVEVGTPLLTFAGIGAIQSIADAVPAATIVADFKALDGVAQYFVHAGRLGAGVATVMAVANEASILKAIETGRASGVKTQVDLLNTPVADLATRAGELADMGADYFLLHLAIDEHLRNPAADPLAGLDAIVAASDVPVGPVVFTVDQGVEAVKRGAGYVVIGYPHLTQPDAADRLQHFADAVRSAR